MKKQALSFHPKLLLRTPLFPFNYFFEASEVVLEKKEFKEAIFLASPGLYEELYVKNSPRDAKLAATLYKYMSRITNRCTPFGLFAGINLLEWTNQPTEVKLKSSDELKRTTTLDMFFVCILGQHLENHKALRKHLRYYPNSSYYIQGKEIRYAEFFYNNNQRTYILSAIENNEYLLTLLQLAEQGANIADLVNYLRGYGFTDGDIYPYIDQLIEAQVLVSELEPSITGEDYLQDIIQVLDRLESQNEELEVIKNTLIAAKLDLEKLDEQQINGSDRYEQLYGLLKGLSLKIDKNKLFQVDSQKEVSKGLLSKRLQSKLLECIEFLALLQQPNQAELERFAGKFYAQYEDKEVPLLTVLDPDLGIGYPIQGLKRDIAPLIKSIYNRNYKAKKVSFSSLDMKLAKLLEKVVVNGERTIDLFKHRKELVDPQATPKNIPPSFSCIVNLIDENTLQLGNCGGVSAVTLAARFATVNKELHDTLQELADHDKKSLPDFDLCEILHLPESRTGNILKHPALLDYEIPYLAKSPEGTTAKVNLRDIRISVSPNNKIYLRNIKTNRYILPRLSNAHNYTMSNQPVYRLLCDLQYQDYIGYLGLSTGKLRSLYSRLPRFTYKDVIIRPASWVLDKKGIETLLKAINSGDTIQAFAAWNKEYELPRLFTASQGDNYVLFDSQSGRSLESLAQFLKNKPKILLKEFIFDPKNCPIKDSNGDAYYNEIIGFIKNAKFPNQRAPKRVETVATRRYFCLGNEWAYYKIYVGTKTTDKLLTQTIQPIAQKLLAANNIDRWFFIRFADPDPHIRLRFRVKQQAQLLPIIQQMNEAFSPLVNDNIISTFQTDIYKREIERYGGEATMALSEELFFIDSTYALKLIHLAQYYQDENLRWKLAIASVDQIVTAFALSIEEKKGLFDSLKLSFEREFKVNKMTRKLIEKRYKENQAVLSKLLGEQSELQLPEAYEHAQVILKEKMEALSPVVTQILAAKEGKQRIILIESYIHMLLNRLFISEPRLHELMVYFFLSRHYNRQYFKNKKSLAHV